MRRIPASSRRHARLVSLVLARQPHRTVSSFQQRDGACREISPIASVADGCVPRTPGAPTRRRDAARRNADAAGSLTNVAILRRFLDFARNDGEALRGAAEMTARDGSSTQAFRAVPYGGAPTESAMRTQQRRTWSCGLSMLNRPKRPVQRPLNLPVILAARPSLSKDPRACRVRTLCHMPSAATGALKREHSPRVASRGGGSAAARRSPWRHGRDSLT
jgi:hypothetical protein